jgi:hypothetical protein
VASRAAGSAFEDGTTHMMMLIDIDAGAIVSDVCVFDGDGLGTAVRGVRALL